MPTKCTIMQARIHVQCACEYKVLAYGPVTPVSKRSNHFLQLNEITNTSNTDSDTSHKNMYETCSLTLIAVTSHTECSHLIDGQKAVGDKIGYKRDEQHGQEVVAELVVTLLVQHKAHILSKHLRLNKPRL